eukprot:Rhum_TRINITY_DN3762_c0_g1::Rhum_TRINITY_DN3762_c0_g1_i1::g.11963::m.11963
MEDNGLTFIKGKLSIVDEGLASLTNIPAQPSSAGPVVALDASENELTTVEGLSRYPDLRTLILDSNEIDSLKGFPLLRDLETLWLNKNGLDDLDDALACLEGKLPSLQYLSLLGNPLCQSELSGASREDVARYRIYVAHHLPSLMFLDSSPITAEEKQTARTRGNYLKVAKPVAAEAAVVAADLPVKKEYYKESATREGNHSTFLGYQKHGYSGKTSEGNRFIKDDQL